MATLGIFVRPEVTAGNPGRHVGSVRIKATKQHLLGTGHHRMFPLAMVTLLAAVFGFNPAARAQNAQQLRVSRAG
jgi:hypothetical protein